jgi:hypothetical protein
MIDTDRIYDFLCVGMSVMSIIYIFTLTGIESDGCTGLFDGLSLLAISGIMCCLAYIMRYKNGLIRYVVAILDCATITARGVGLALVVKSLVDQQCPYECVWILSVEALLSIPLIVMIGCYCKNIPDQSAINWDDHQSAYQPAINPSDDHSDAMARHA